LHDGRRRLALTQEDVISSVSLSDPLEPPGAPADPRQTAAAADGLAPRWLLVLAWSSGLAGLYTLASLVHAALVEGILSVDVAFGRALAFWVGTIYLALLAWGFLPARPTGWYARRGLVLAVLTVGLLSAVVSGAITGLWLATHWMPSVGVPVVASIAVLLVSATGVLWLAGHDERKAKA
jgi:hypothetical protein